MNQENPFERTASYSVVLCSLALGSLLVIVISLFLSDGSPSEQKEVTAVTPSREAPPDIWTPPDTSAISHAENEELIRYGRELISHTAIYLGPRGKVGRLTNGMNCQNCHLAAGTKPFGNNYAFVASTYPRFRARSGTVESVEKRINDCLERSLNGKALADTSKEMRAMKAYILWVGKGVGKDATPLGGGLGDLPFLDRAADPMKGKAVFEKHCVRCHGPEGKGRRVAGSVEWIYPPLVGDSSYTIGAGLYRLSRFAAYVRNNMPEGTSYLKPLLSIEEAWDAAAYINSLPRPSKDISKDWPDIAKKPFDHPFGPYADSFSATQHKYGPFSAITKK